MVCRRRGRPRGLHGRTWAGREGAPFSRPHLHRTHPICHRRLYLRAHQYHIAGIDRAARERAGWRVLLRLGHRLEPRVNGMLTLEMSRACRCAAMRTGFIAALARVFLAAATQPPHAQRVARLILESEDRPLAAEGTDRPRHLKAAHPVPTWPGGVGGGEG